MDTMDTSQLQAKIFFSAFYLGAHHIPKSGLKPIGEGWYVSHPADLATFDADDLTRLVFLAHDMCFRVSVQPGGALRVKICIWKRAGRTGRMYQRHPDINKALEVWQKVRRDR
jgi:hypothetical protein